jgi:hypothetical protein
VSSVDVAGAVFVTSVVTVAGVVVGDPPGERRVDCIVVAAAVDDVGAPEVDVAARPLAVVDLRLVAPAVAAGA